MAILGGSPQTDPDVVVTGVVGNGIADDTAPFLAAFATLKAQANNIGGVVQIPPGIFNLASWPTYGVSWGDRCIVVRGSGSGSQPNTGSTLKIPAGCVGFNPTNGPTTRLSGSTTFPVSPVSVVDTTGFPTSGTLNVGNGLTFTTVAYTGISGNSFTGVTGGSGTFVAGDQIGTNTGRGARSAIQDLQLIGADTVPGTNDGILVQANETTVRNVVVSGFAGWGINILTSPSQFASINADNVRLDLCYALGNFSGGIRTQGVNGNSGTFTATSAVSNGVQNTLSGAQTLPVTPITLASAAGFPTGSTTAAASNPTSPSANLLPTTAVSTLTVASTTGFPAWYGLINVNGGLVYYDHTDATHFYGCLPAGGVAVSVPNSSAVNNTVNVDGQIVTYTGVSGNQLTGCTGGGLAAPVQANATTATTGGTGLTAATPYFYVVTARNAHGETVISNEKTVTTGAGTTNSNTINWATVPGAYVPATGLAYRIYRSLTSGSYTGATYYDVAGAAATSFVDTGTAGTTGTPPASNTTGSMPSGMGVGGPGWQIVDGSNLQNNWFGIHTSTAATGAVLIITGTGSRMYGVYFESQNCPGLVVMSGRNVFEGNHMTRIDGQSAVNDVSGLTNHVLSDSTDLHWRKMRVGNDFGQSGNGILIDGVANTLSLLLGAQLILQPPSGGASSQNWTLTTASGGALALAQTAGSLLTISNPLSMVGTKGAFAHKRVASSISGASPTIDASTGDILICTLTANITTASITNGTTGQIVVLELVQDATGSRTATWATNMKFAGAAAPTLTVTPSQRDILTFEYNAGTGNWYEVSRALGVAA